MRISQHAAQRFLERAVGEIIPGSYAKPFVIPGFEDFKVIHRAGVVVTIIPKND